MQEVFLANGFSGPDKTRYNGQAWFFISQTSFRSGVVGGPVRKVVPFVVPAGVYNIHAAALGGGGAGGYTRNSAQLGAASGAGGGLSWRNLIPVTPGETLYIALGYGGPISAIGVRGNGGISGIARQYNSQTDTIDEWLLLAYGGTGATYYAGAPYGEIGIGGEGGMAAKARLEGDGSGRTIPDQFGGTGGNGAGDNYSGSGGGGAGGWYGKGGNGGLGGASGGSGGAGGSPEVGSGAGAGGSGGGGTSPYHVGAFGATTQLYGHGADGIARPATAATTDASFYISQMGSRYVPATKGATDPTGAANGNVAPLDGTLSYWGVGGYGGGPLNTGVAGGDGVVRVVWGRDRQFGRNIYVPDV